MSNYQSTDDPEFFEEHSEPLPSVPWKKMTMTAVTVAAIYFVWENGHYHGRQEVYEQVETLCQPEFQEDLD